jgi:glycine/D-amino acid oxidase-like deaminating enzyme
MRIAVVGAGFAGLGVAWHLMESSVCEVVICDAKGIGGGASGLASGLMHPYVGEESRRSLLASEGMQAARELIDVVETFLGEGIARREGILRHVVSEAQRQQFLSHCERFGDVEQVGESCFWITSGMTIDSSRYLHGLWQALAAKGVQLLVQDVPHLQSLQGFDHIIVAAGAGIARFPELSSIAHTLLKGQVLRCRAGEGLQLPFKSSICKGYLALASEEGMCHLGSTYERGMQDESADAEVAKQILLPKMRLFFPEVDKLEVVGCRAAFRVIRKGHYFPVASKIREGLWVLTGLGSRGLLYHAFLGKLLAEAVVTDDDRPLSLLFNNALKN